MKKTIFLDLDGTLLNDKSLISEKNINILIKLKSQGFNIILITGRPFCASIDYYTTIKCNSFLITSNGALISKPCDKNFNDIVSYFDLNEHHNLFKDIKNYTSTALFNINDMVYIYNDNGLLDYYKHGATPSKIVINEFDKINTTPTGILYLIKKENDEVFRKVIDEKYKNIAYRYWGIFRKDVNLNLYEVYLKDSAKEKSILKLSQLYNIDLKDAIFIGDGINDVESFKIVGESVAMLNSSDIVKQYAKHITKYTNNSDGVYHYLKKYLH